MNHLRVCVCVHSADISGCSPDLLCVPAEDSGSSGAASGVSDAEDNDDDEDDEF